ncbi:MAG: PAS domain S-box protein [Ignavibacteriales bacterium]
MNNMNNEQSFFPILQQVINFTSDAISVLDLDYKYIYINKSFEELFGYSKEELIGHSSDFLASPKNPIALNKKIVKGTLAGGWEGEYIGLKKDGSELFLYLKTTLLKNDSGKPIGVIASSRDLTIIKEKEKSLKETESRFKDLFENIKDTVYESTPDGKLLDINQAGLDLFGYTSKEELMSSEISQTLYVDPAEREIFKSILEKEGSVNNYEITLRKKSGEEITVLETSTAVKDANGKVIAYRGIIRDITDEKNNKLLLSSYLEELAQTNEQVRISEAELKRINAEKDKFFSIIAHDLKNPFNSLLGLSEILIEDIETLTKEEIVDFSSSIHSASRAIMQLLNNLLDWARIQTGRIKHEPENINMQELFDENIELLSQTAKNKKINLSSEINTSSVIFADRYMINCVVQNLITNAIKFTKEKDSITASVIESENSYTFSVKDTGIGIKPEDQSKLFKIDAHHTTKGTNNEAGTGLGLILCKELIEKNKGTIWVESEFGKGTTFFFSLPKPSGNN